MLLTSSDNCELGVTNNRIMQRTMCLLLQQRISWLTKWHGNASVGGFEIQTVHSKCLFIVEFVMTAEFVPPLKLTFNFERKTEVF